MSNSVGGAIAEGIQGGWQMGLQSDAAAERKREFDREQATRESAEARMAKQEDDRYGRQKDAARVQASEAHLANLDKQIAAIVNSAGAKAVPEYLFEQRARAQMQLDDMHSQIQSTGRLSSSSPASDASSQAAPQPAAQPAPQPTPQSAQAPAPAPPTMGLAAAMPAAPPPPPPPPQPAAPAAAGLGAAPAQPGLGPQPGPAAAAPPMDDNSPVVGAAPDAGVAPPVAGGAPAAGAVSSPTTSAVTPSQKLVADTDQQSQNLASRLQTGQLGLKDVKPVDYALMVASATGHAPDQLDQVRQHIADWQTGMTTGNNGLVLQGLNGIFGPRIQQGVGEPSPHGGTITGKSIIGLDPAMSADGTMHADKVIPRLQVTTDVMGANGQPLSYHAPMTQNRSSAPNDPVTAIPIADAANHIGAMGALVEAASHPDAQALLAAGSKDPRVQQYLDAARLAAQPADPVAAKQAIVDKYKKLWGTDDDATMQRLVQLGFLKPMPQLKGAVAQSYDVAQQMVDNGDAPDIRTALGMVQRTMHPSKYGVGGGGGGAPGAGGGGGASSGSASVAPGTVNPVTGSAVLPPPDKSGLIMGLTPRAIDDAAWAYADTGKLPTGMSRSKDSDPMKKMLMNRAGELMQKAGISPEQFTAGTQQFKADAKSLSMQQSRADAIESGMSKIEPDIGTIQSTIADGNAGFAPWLNKPLNALRTQAGSPSLAAYSLAVKQVAIEYERMINGGQMSVAQLHQGAQDDAKSILNENMSVETVNSVIPTMLREMHNAQTATRGQLATIQKRMATHGAGGGDSASPAAAGAGGAGPTQIRDAAGYAALPSGAHYVDPNGVARIKQ